MVEEGEEKEVPNSQGNYHKGVKKEWEERPSPGVWVGALKGKLASLFLLPFTQRGLIASIAVFG